MKKRVCTKKKLQSSIKLIEPHHLTIFASITCGLTDLISIVFITSIVCKRLIALIFHYVSHGYVSHGTNAFM